MSELGSKTSPVHTKIVGDGGIGKLVAFAVLSLAPIAATVLAQNPALRQALELRAWALVRSFAARNAVAWRKLESVAATRYDIARL